MSNKFDLLFLSSSVWEGGGGATYISDLDCQKFSSILASELKSGRQMTRHKESNLGYIGL